MTVEQIQSPTTIVKAGDLGWMCRGMVLSWRTGTDDLDAARLFAEVFGLEATRAHHNKFPTASMPCRSWACGTINGMSADLRLSVDDAYSQLRLQSEKELIGGNVALFRSCIDRLEAAAGSSVADCHTTLDLELPHKADHEGFMRWLGHEDWHSNALLLTFEYVFAPRGGRTEVSVTASIDRRSERLGLTIGISAPTCHPRIPSSEIFTTLDSLLATRQLADISAL